MRYTEKIQERFWGKVDASGPCWQWMGAGAGKGYGKIGVVVDGKPSYPYAHRVAWEILVGEIPEGKELDHLCKNRRCVNPDHLEPVTRRQNLARSAAVCTLNSLKSSCPQGHPYEGDNLIQNKYGRACRECRRAYDRKRRPREGA